MPQAVPSLPAPGLRTPDKGSLRGIKGVGTPQVEPHKARTAVTGQIYLQRASAHDPKVVNERFMRLHAENSPPDEMEVTLDTWWTGFDLSRVPRPGLIVIVNTGTPPATKPPDRASEYDWPANSVEIGLAVDDTTLYGFGVVPPGESARLTPFLQGEASRLRIRARSGSVPVMIVLFPV